MVLGGQFFNTSSRLHDMVPQVEVLGPEKACQVDLLSMHNAQNRLKCNPQQIGSLPSPLYGLTAAKIGDSVIACGGYHYYYR